MLTREAQELVEAIHGSQVTSAEVFAGLIVLELFHHGTDDGARRVAFNLSGAVADEWPWPQGDAGAADSDPRSDA